MGVIMHENVAYGGGSVVEANKTGATPTDNLSTLTIDGVTYDTTELVFCYDDNGSLYTDSTKATAVTGDESKLYIATNTGKQYRYNGSTFSALGVNAIGDLSDVTITSASDGQALEYDGTASKWKNVAKKAADTPTFSEASTRANISGSGETMATILGKIKKFFSDLKAVAFTGAYSDLSGTPTIPTVNDATLTIQKNGTAVETFTANSSTNKTANITVPTGDLASINKDGTSSTKYLRGDGTWQAFPSIPAAQINSDWNASSGVAQILNKPTLATVATSGSYNDLSNKPTIPAAQIQSNWTQTTTTALDYIKNKPALATVATSGSYNDLSNKPTIPTVNNGTLTIQKNGTQVQTFTANQSANATANIECATPSDVEGSKTITGNPLTITDAAPIKAEQLVFEIEPIQAGSGTPSPSNIRPITGLSEVSVDRCGKNLFGDIQYGYTTDSSGKIIENANSWICKLKCDNTKENIYIKIFDKGTYTGSFWVEYSLDGETFTNIGIGIQFPQISNGYTANANIPQGTKCLIVGGFMSSHGTNHNIDSTKVQVQYSAVGDTYEPYNSQHITCQLGNKNLLPMTVEGIKAANNGTWNGNSITKNNITFTILTDKDGNVTGIKANGTASGGDATIHVVLDYESLSAGKYIVNGSIGGSASTYDVYCGFRISGTVTYFNSYNGDSNVITYGASDKIYFIDVRIRNTKAVSNQMFYPMLRSASITDSTFSPYNPTLGGMVYGGNLTVNADGSAECYVDRAFAEFDGSDDENWTLVDNNSIKTDYIFPAMKTATSTWIYAMSSDFPAGSDGVAPSTWLTTYATNNPTALEFRNIVSNWGISAYTVNAWKSYLASRSTPLQVAYELKDPFTIHLTAEQLQLLENLNNISTNAKTLTVKYQPNNAIGEAKGLAMGAMMSTTWTSLGVFSHGASPTIPQCKELLLISVSEDGTEYYDGQVYPYALYGVKFLYARPLNTSYVCVLKTDGAVIAGGTYKLAIFYR